MTREQEGCLESRIKRSTRLKAKEIAQISGKATWKTDQMYYVFAA